MMKRRRIIDTPAHAELGASSSYRWMNCLGSPREVAAIPPELREKTSIYAYEGTAAHALMERCLRNGRFSPIRYKGWMIAVYEVGDQGHTECRFYKPDEVEADDEIAKGSAASFIVDQGMMEAVHVVLDHVSQEIDRLKKKYRKSEVILYIEERVYPLKEYRDMYGTADVILVAVGEEVVVIDYKHGAGVPVDVEGNTQVRYYGLGALRKIKFKAKKVKVTIVQPRAIHEDGAIRSQRIDADALETWGSQVLLKAVRKTEKRNAPLKAGDWCKKTWCPARGTCPELRRSIAQQAQIDFEDEPHEIPAKIDPKEVGHFLLWKPMLEAWISGIESLAYRIAENGGTVPEHKLIYGRSNREFNPAISPNRLLSRLEKFTKLSRDKLFNEPKLKSPAQIEKMVKPAKRELFNEKFVVKPKGKLTLVHESNTSPAVSVNPADDFKEDVE